jgi:hypothetical protein
MRIITGSDKYSLSMLSTTPNGKLGHFLTYLVLSLELAILITVFFFFFILYRDCVYTTYVISQMHSLHGLNAFDFLARADFAACALLV